jgi:hypothetical protein
MARAVRNRLRLFRSNTGRRSLAILAMAGLLLAGVGLEAGATLPGSNFEGHDGNFVPNGGVDWTSPAPNLHVGQDAINSQADNSFGQGTAENDTNVTVISGSIPNSKADLAQFLVSNEQVANGDIFLYLGGPVPTSRGRRTSTLRSTR